jgi:hypothetical protein
VYWRHLFYNGFLRAQRILGALDADISIPARTTRRFTPTVGNGESINGHEETLKAA